MSKDKILKELTCLAQVIAVSKTKTVGEILELYVLGQRNFGENYVQEALTKIPILPKDCKWHYIGKIQNNKLLKIVENFDCIQTISAEREIIKLSKILEKLNKNINILLQVNISDDKNKNGIVADIDIIAYLIEIIKQYPRINLVGLMCIPSKDDNEAYQKMDLLFTKLQKKYQFLTTLSMGMSEDYEVAIKNGANMIRIGTLLFGIRNDKK